MAPTSSHRTPLGGPGTTWNWPPGRWTPFPPLQNLAKTRYSTPSIVDVEWKHWSIPSPTHTLTFQQFCCIPGPTPSATSRVAICGWRRFRSAGVYCKGKECFIFARCFGHSVRAACVFRPFATFTRSTIRSTAGCSAKSDPCASIRIQISTEEQTKQCVSDSAIQNQERRNPSFVTHRMGNHHAPLRGKDAVYRKGGRRTLCERGLNMARTNALSGGASGRLGGGKRAHWMTRR